MYNGELSFVVFAFLCVMQQKSYERKNNSVELVQWRVKQASCKLLLCLCNRRASLVAQIIKSLIPGLGRFPGEGNGNPFQYSFFFFFALRIILLFFQYKIKLIDHFKGTHFS